MQLPKFGSGSFQDLSVGLGNTVEPIIQTNLHTMQELFRSAGPVAMAELQQRLSAITSMLCYRAASPS